MKNDETIFPILETNIQYIESKIQLCETIMSMCEINIENMESKIQLYETKM